MNTDRTTKTLLVLIAVALWGILLRPLSVAGPAQAQPSPQIKTTAALRPPMILAAQEGIPYLVVSEGHISVWYVDTQMDKLDRHTLTARKIMENTRLIRADEKALSNP